MIHHYHSYTVQKFKIQIMYTIISAFCNFAIKLSTIIVLSFISLCVLLLLVLHFISFHKFAEVIH